MPLPPRRRPDDRRDDRRDDDRRRDERRPGGRDPYLSGMILDAEVLDAEVLDADVLDADVLDADVLDASVVDAVIEAEVLDAEPLPADDGPPATFDLDALGGGPLPGTTPAPSLPVYESVPADQLPTGADLLVLDADPPRPATRTAARPATVTRPAVRITFVCPGEQSPFAARG